jgi:hypothetical protein
VGALIPFRRTGAADDLNSRIERRTTTATQREPNGHRVAQTLESVRTGGQARRIDDMRGRGQIRRLRLGAELRGLWRDVRRLGRYGCGGERRFGNLVHRRRCWDRGHDLVDGLVPEEQLRGIRHRGALRALADQLPRLRLIARRRTRRPGQRCATLRTEPRRSLDWCRPVVMGRSLGQVVLLRDQTDLAEQFVHCVIRNVDTRERADSRRLLTEMAERRPAAIARDEVSLKLAGRLDVELGVDVAAEREEAAPHIAISR